MDRAAVVVDATSEIGGLASWGFQSGHLAQPTVYGPLWQSECRLGRLDRG